MRSSILMRKSDAIRIIIVIAIAIQSLIMLPSVVRSQCSEDGGGSASITSVWAVHLHNCLYRVFVSGTASPCKCYGNECAVCRAIPSVAGLDMYMVSTNDGCACTGDKACCTTQGTCGDKCNECSDHDATAYYDWDFATNPEVIVRVCYSDKANYGNCDYGYFSIMDQEPTIEKSGLPSCGWFTPDANETDPDDDGVPDCPTSGESGPDQSCPGNTGPGKIDFPNQAVILAPHTDFIINNRKPIEFIRMYTGSFKRADLPFGQGWTHNYDFHLWEEWVNGWLIVFQGPDGRYHRYQRYSNRIKSFLPDGTRMWVDSSTGNYRLELADGDIYYFDNNKKVTEIHDKLGGQISLTYDGDTLASIYNGTTVTNQSIIYWTFA